MKTELKLLTRDGAVFMAFRPCLSGEQYAGLLALTKQQPTVAQMRWVVSAWASHQKLEVCFDESAAARWQTAGSNS